MRPVGCLGSDCRTHDPPSPRDVRDTPCSPPALESRTRGGHGGPPLRGRFTLGVGLGDLNDPGFGRFGEETDARRRAEMLDEGLEIIVGLWSGQPFSFRGKHFAVHDATLLPKPVQEPRIPIWIGGGYPNRGPTQRALCWDGSMLYKEGEGYMTPADVRGLKELAGSRPFEIAVGGSARRDDWDEEREWIRGVADAGATWWMEWVRPADRETMRAVVERGPLRID